MFITRVFTTRALRFVSSSISSSASFISFTFASFISFTSSASYNRYVSAEIRAFRRAARALKVLNLKLANSSIFEHVINLIKQTKIYTNMKFINLRIKLFKHFRQMTKIIKQIWLNLRSFNLYTTTIVIK